MSVGLIYATVADLRGYSLSPLTDDDSYLEKILERAERDVDRNAGYWNVLTNGRKFDPVSMEARKRQALARATCAQAEYRLQMGEAFFIEAVPASVSGDDTNYTGRPPRFGPKAREEMQDAQLIRAGGRTKRNRLAALYPDWAQAPTSRDTSNSFAGEVED